MKLIDEIKDGMERAEAGTDTRIEKARREKGLPVWLAGLIDVLTVALCAYGIFVAGGVWIPIGLLFGVISLAELAKRVFGVIR